MNKCSTVFTKENCRNPETLTIHYGYLVECSEGHGCSGTTQRYHVFLPAEQYGPVETRKYSVLAKLRKRMEEHVTGLIDEMQEAARKQAGPRPVWDENWAGTRKEYEEALAVYNKKVEAGMVKQDEMQLLSQEWEKNEGVHVLYADWEVQGVNEYGEKEKSENSLLALVLHDDKGCRCMGSSRRVLDEYEEEELEANPDGEHGYTIANLTAPRVTLVEVNSEWQFLTLGHPDEAVVRELLCKFAGEWERKEEEDEEKTLQLQTEYDMLLSDEEVADLPYSLWQHRKDEPNRKRSLEWQIRSRGNSNNLPLDNVKTPLHMTLRGIVRTNDLGWIVDGMTHGRIWTGQGRKAEEY